MSSITHDIDSSLNCFLTQVYHVFIQMQSLRSALSNHHNFCKVWYHIFYVFILSIIFSKLPVFLITTLHSNNQLFSDVNVRSLNHPAELFQSKVKLDWFSKFLAQLQPREPKENIQFVWKFLLK